MRNNYGKHERVQYAFRLPFVSNDFYRQPFGRKLDDMKKIKEFKETAKTTHVGAKGRATLAAVKEWVKENKPSQFYASWQADSPYYKDDSVQVFYN